MERVACSGGHMKRILVIEDSVEFREYVAEILRLCGFALDEAPDAERAIVLAHQAHPDLILCDLHLPGTDGYSVVQTIRRHEGRVPFVVLSADAEEAERSIELGAEAYIVKPIAVNDLVNLVRRCMEDLPEAA
jgi:CheY-like chemotaxis protein